MAERFQDLLHELLIDVSFLKALAGRLERERASSARSEELDYAEADSYERLQRDKRIILGDGGSTPRLQDLFEKYVISGLPAPALLSVEDLNECAYSQLGGVPHDHFAESAWRFILYVLDRLEHQSSESFKLGAWGDPNGDMKDSPYEGFDLWTSDRELGFWLDFEDDGSNTVFQAAPAVGYFLADASPTAWKAIQPEFARLVASIMKSLHMIVPKVFPEAAVICGGFETRCVQWQLLAEGFGRRFISENLSSYFTPAERKTDSMAQRMRNAVQLLVEADAQQNRSLGLSLCVSAIEALLCSSTQNIAEQMAGRVAVILCSDGSQRPQVIKTIKKLYNKRSKALHGESMTADTASYDEARCLAAGVLGAVIEWQDYEKRVGSEGERKTFLERLEADKYAGKRMVGIPEGFSKCLPGSE